MPEPRDIDSEGQSLVPQPDPWGPPGANALQAASIASGATGAALLAGDSSTSPDTYEGLLALIPDPTQVFGRVAHVLGFQFDASDAWTWGLVLVVLSVALNIISLALRYRYARYIVTEQAKNRARDAQAQASAAATRKGFISGEG
jgi:hypothetical protein